MRTNEDRAIIQATGVVLVVLIIIFGAISGYYRLAGAASTWTDKFSLEMPAQGDVGWDDAIRANYKILEAITAPLLEGHLVKSGVTPTDGGGLVVSWAAGTVKFKGKEYAIAAGSTDFANNTINWLSAVTIEGSSGATIDLRSTEYYPPSNVSGYYTPIAIAFTEAGSIARLKDVRFIQEGRYGQDQDLETGDNVTFNRVYVADQADANNINARSGVSAENVNARSGVTAHDLSANAILAGVSKWYVYGGVTLNQTQLAGGMIYCHAPIGSGPIVIGISAISSSTGYVLVKDMTGSGVTIQTTDGDVLYNNSDAGTAIFVNAGNSRHQAAITLNAESGTCKYADVIGTIGSSWYME